MSAPARAVATVLPLPVSGGRTARRSTPLWPRPRTPRQHSPGLTLHRLCIWRQCYVFMLGARPRYALSLRIRLPPSSKPIDTHSLYTTQRAMYCPTIVRMDVLEAMLPYDLHNCCTLGAFARSPWVCLRRLRSVTQRERATHRHRRWGLWRSATPGVHVVRGERAHGSLVSRLSFHW